MTAGVSRPGFTPTLVGPGRFSFGGCRVAVTRPVRLNMPPPAASVARPSCLMLHNVPFCSGRVATPVASRRPPTPGTHAVHTRTHRTPVGRHFDACVRVRIRRFATDPVSGKLLSTHPLTSRFRSEGVVLYTEDVGGSIPSPPISTTCTGAHPGASPGKTGVSTIPAGAACAAMRSGACVCCAGICAARVPPPAAARSKWSSVTWR